MFQGMEGLDRATEEMDNPDARNKNLYSSTYTVYTVYKTLCPGGDTSNYKGQPQKQGEG
jgi:hypothetical protein